LGRPNRHALEALDRSQGDHDAGYSTRTFSICEECWRWPDEQAPGHIVLIVEPGYEETAERFRRWQAGERDAADDNA
jgi:hypothetical protein